MSTEFGKFLVEIVFSCALNAFSPNLWRKSLIISYNSTYFRSHINDKIMNYLEEEKTHVVVKRILSESNKTSLITRLHIYNWLNQMPLIKLKSFLTISYRFFWVFFCLALCCHWISQNKLCIMLIHYRLHHLIAMNIIRASDVTHFTHCTHTHNTRISQTGYNTEMKHFFNIQRHELLYSFEMKWLNDLLSHRNAHNTNFLNAFAHKFY